MFYYLLDLRELADAQTHVHNARLALYFERNSRLNFAKIVLGYAKPVLRSPFLPTSLVHLSRKVSELETMANDNRAGEWFLTRALLGGGGRLNAPPQVFRG